MINSRKAIWADNLCCVHVPKLRQAALCLFLRTAMCVSAAAEIYIVLWLVRRHTFTCLCH